MTEPSQPDPFAAGAGVLCRAPCSASTSDHVAAHGHCPVAVVH